MGVQHYSSIFTYIYIYTEYVQYSFLFTGSFKHVFFLNPHLSAVKGHQVTLASSDRFGKYMGSKKFYEIPRELPSRGGVCRWQGEAIYLKNGY